MKAAPRVALLLALFAMAALPSAGQNPVVNPKVLDFDPSPDHAGLTADGQARVQRYDLQIFAAGAASPMMTTSLGKPAPDTDGKIRVDLSTLLTAWPLAAGTYEARVEAVGPTGSGLSGVSNPFSLEAAGQACTYGVSTASQAFGYAAGSGSVTVTASAAGCGWTASSDAAWAVVGPAGGTGTGTVSVTVEANAGAARTATLTIGGQTVTVTQAAAPPPCTFALAAPSQSLAAQAGTGGTTVNASAPSCAWTATTTASWITLTAGSASGTGPMTFSVTKNASGAVRTATITAGGQTFSVSQATVTRPTSPRNVKVGL